MKSIVSLACAILLTLISSCFDCKEYVPQKFKFGVYHLKVIASDTILVGDKIVVSITLPKHFYDSISGTLVEIDKKIEIFNKLDEYAGTSNSDNFFLTPETIFKTFDQYFNLEVKKGQLINVYNFSCLQENGNWKLELEYTTKKKGMFYFSTAAFTEIKTSKTDLPKGVCMTGDPVLNATIQFEGDNNKADQLFQPDQSLVAQYYGFIVE